MSPNSKPDEQPALRVCERVALAAVGGGRAVAAAAAIRARRLLRRHPTHCTRAYTLWGLCCEYFIHVLLEINPTNTVNVKDCE